jgi:hypothetical protein
LLEFFAPVLDGRHWERIDVLAEVQEELGKLNDLVVSETLLCQYLFELGSTEVAKEAVIFLGAQKRGACATQSTCYTTCDSECAVAWHVKGHLRAIARVLLVHLAQGEPTGLVVMALANTIAIDSCVISPLSHRTRRIIEYLLQNIVEATIFIATYSGRTVRVSLGAIPEHGDNESVVF